MRIKNKNDLNDLGLNARSQIELDIKKNGGFNSPSKNKKTSNHKASQRQSEGKNKKASRVMKTHDNLNYCPWPSSDPFVKVYQLLELHYGRYEDGGMLVTEMVVDGGSKEWRFDFALLPKLSNLTSPIDKCEDIKYIGDQFVLLEADGFMYHRSLSAFKNDRAKQTHALKKGFVVKRITNEDVNKRLDCLILDINEILLHKRLYSKNYSVAPKGKTMSLFKWNN